MSSKKDLKKVLNQPMILPSLSWTKEQLEMYFSFLKRKDVVLAYYWTRGDNLPIHGNRDEKWKVKPGAVQKAQHLPKGCKFGNEFGCSRYALHATYFPSQWQGQEDRHCKLWIVAMHGNVFNHGINKLIAQKRTIIGQISKREFNRLNKLLGLALLYTGK